MIVSAAHRAAFEAEIGGRRTHPRVRIVLLAEGESAGDLGEDAVATAPVAGASLVTAAEAAAAALTGERTDPSLTRAPGRQQSA